ncbi:MAG: DsbA family protein [Proteobacteria bacterium]|nr:DsbA family protein [Pseudomonadota bacterium]
MLKFRRRNALLALPGVALLLGGGGLQAADDPKELAKRLMAAVPPHGERTLGDPQAPVTMIEYASATCPHCAEFHNDVWPTIKKDYVDTGKVFFVFREFPTDELALGAFMLARCAPADRYFDAIDMMFEKQQVWTKNNPKEELFKIMESAGLDEKGASACIKNRKLFNDIQATLETANKTFGVKGTPTFFVNGTYLDGHKDPEQVRSFIDAQLAQAN